MMDWQNLSVLITGGTGSFGRKFAQVMLDDFHPRRLIIFSRDELKQHEMRVSGFDHPSLRYFIGDVRDVDRLRRAFQGVDVVVHAAALKQVPACEYNPIEAVMTNVMGARNVIDAALDCGVERVLAMSTDKATAPVNLYGATKLVAEKLFVQANSYGGAHGTRFACVRYGNVVGSRGSVIPLFKQQRKSGRLTITDPRMTRFWITLEQGVRFVIESIEMMHGGEVFIPKLPSMNIMDLVKAIGAGCEVDIVGIRPGEKLHESMISEDEAPQAVDLGQRFAILPAHPWWSSDYLPHGAKLPDGFAYRSDTNDRWLSLDELAAMAAAE